MYLVIIWLGCSYEPRSRAPGQACMEDIDCTEGMICPRGRCWYPIRSREPGERCIRGAECVEPFLCDSGFCPSDTGLAAETTCGGRIRCGDGTCSIFCLTCGQGCCDDQGGCD